jgi:dTDP-glucose pyrophosphorylase
MKYTGVIPAAGKGRRIAASKLTRVLPKPLIPINGMCIIESSIMNLERAGISDIIVIVNYKADLIRDFLDDGRDWGVDIEYVYQPTLNGIGGAILDAESCIPGDFVVALGDEITLTNNIVYILKKLETTPDALIVEAAVNEYDRRIIEQTNEILLDSTGRIMEIREKPVNPRTLTRGIGLYACKHEVLDYIKKTPPSPIRGEIEISDVIANIIRNGGGAYAEWLQGFTVNINTLDDLLNAERVMIGRTLWD